MRIAIIDYGAGNTQSVKYALKRLGCKGILTSDKEIISSSDKVIFPGVGRKPTSSGKLNFLPLRLPEKILKVLLISFIWF